MVRVPLAKCVPTYAYRRFLDFERFQQFLVLMAHERLHRAAQRGTHAPRANNDAATLSEKLLLLLVIYMRLGDTRHVQQKLKRIHDRSGSRLRLI